MREIAQLIFSIFVGLLPLWILILRSRRRRQAQNNPVKPVHAEPQVEEEAEVEMEPMLDTDSIWGTQHFTHSARPYTEREEEESTQLEDNDTDTFLENDKRAMNASTHFTDMHDTITTHQSPAAEHTFAFDAQPSSASHIRPTPLSTQRHTSVMPIRSISLNTLPRSEIQRAVILSEILSSPRAVRPLHDDT